MGPERIRSPSKSAPASARQVQQPVASAQRSNAAEIEDLVCPPELGENRSAAPIGFGSRRDEPPVSCDGGGVQMLVGGPYTDAKGRDHRYGHSAVRVFDGCGDRDTVYDFGRYGETRGDFSAEGEGILREWDGGLDPYLELQHRKGRETTGYTFPAEHEDVQASFAKFDAMIAAGELQQEVALGNGAARRTHRLADDYHGIDHNCTTLSIDGFETAVPGVDLDVSTENQGRGLNGLERMAASGVEGWNEEIFMPADLKAVLDGQPGEGALVEQWTPGTENPHQTLRNQPFTCGGS